MKPSNDWRFSCPLSEVDVFRIVKEAGPAAKCVRLTIDGKTYTAVNRHTAPFPRGARGSITTDDFVTRADNGGVDIWHDPGMNNTWLLYLGDVTGEVMDRVKVVVEVFE